MTLEVNLLYLLIIACEILFWVFLFSGLALRYVFNQQLIGTYVLYTVPFIDLFLLIFSAVDLHKGENATFAHGLAAAYIGFTVAFGLVIIDWADKWFAYKFSGSTRPLEEPTVGWQAVVYEMKVWGRCIIAVFITYGLLSTMVGYINEPSRTEALNIWFKIPFFTIILWFLFGPLWRIIFLSVQTRAATIDFRLPSYGS
ncbi:MAG: hypothetical protein JKY34_04405 [Kordiimonadaceae bacterium]|nr:hypothetical protein [Kordiimonadaceae bacterium]